MGGNGLDPAGCGADIGAQPTWAPDGAEISTNPIDFLLAWPRMRQSQLRKWTMRTALVALLVLGAAGCGGQSSASESGGDGSGGKLTLVAYSTPEEAYKELIPAFNETPQGKGVGFDQSYASSGEQSRAVEGGLPADVVEF